MPTNAPTPAAERRWFDAHLDLAYLAALGRDMHAEPEHAGGPDLPAAVTLASLRAGRVEACLGTIFVEAGGSDPRASYASGDFAAAHARAVEQLRTYESWRERGQIEWLTGGTPLQSRAPSPLRLGILIEGADVIRSPDELSWWRDHGVVAVGLAWWKASRYAGGNGTLADSPEAGLSSAGRALVGEIDRLGLVHDVSHLADRAHAELMEHASPHAKVIASHSNARALLGDPANQRHLTDAHIRALASRGGVIGLNLLSRFLVNGGAGSGAAGGEAGARATIGQTLAHVEHICMLAGSTRHVGLGSDMDGGFSALRLPEAVTRPRDLDRLADGLHARGWSDADIHGFMWGNWTRVFRVLSDATPKPER